MTIKVPKLNVFDKLLYSLGKKRGVLLPMKTDNATAKYSYYMGRKESFWRAFLRPNEESLPMGMIDLFKYHNTNPN